MIKTFTSATATAALLAALTTTTTTASADDLGGVEPQFGLGFHLLARGDKGKPAPDDGSDGGGGGGGGGGKGGGKPDKGGGGSGDGGGGTGGGGPGTYHAWMHPDVPQAWSLGFDGAGSFITHIDDYNPETSTLVSLDLNMDGVMENMYHGNAVRAFSDFISTGATHVRQQYDASAMPTRNSGFEVINLSFGLMTDDGTYQDDWLLTGGHTLETEIIRLAFVDTYAAGAESAPVIVKAAGNGGMFGTGGVIGEYVGADLPWSPFPWGFVDVLGHDLIGGDNVIFAGALDANGTIDGNGQGTGVLAAYSDHPGANPLTQAQTLVVGVDQSLMGTAGTSFAAPIISSYAAIVADKFSDENLGTQPHAGLVVDRLLDTARTDTLLAYDPFYHGQGEASLSRAVAPDWISGN